MKALFAISALALGALALLAPTSGARADEYPIEWTENISLNSLDEIDRLLTERNEGLDLKRYDRKTGRADKRHVASCKEFLAAIDEGFYVNGTRLELAQFAWSRASCGFFSKLRTATPAKRSFVRNFRLDEWAPNFLPPRLEFDLWNSDQHGCKGMLERYPAAKQAGLSWAAFHRLIHDEYWRVEYPGLFESAMSEIRLLETTSPNSASYSDQPDDPYSRVNIEIWGWADFNGDGLDDIFIVVGSTITILTRGSSSAVLTYAEPPLIDDRAICDW